MSWGLPASYGTPGLYDYVYGGPGRPALDALASAAADMTLSGKYGELAMPPSGTPVVGIAVNQALVAVWSGHRAEAQALAAAIVATLVAGERGKPSPAPLWDIGQRVVQGLGVRLWNDGDPGGCLNGMATSLRAWSQAPAVVQSKESPTGWCQRELVLAANAPCTLVGSCRYGSDGKVLPAPVPARGALITLLGGSLAPPPTHDEIDQAIRDQLSSQGEGLETLEDAEESAELRSYLAAFGQARLELTVALGVPTNATDAVITSALAARGVTMAEASDWFVGCNADAACFRERMLSSLEEADRTRRTARTKALAVLATVAAAGFAYRAYRHGR